MTEYAEDLITNETVRDTMLKAYRKGHTYKHESWPKDLWGWKYSDIIEFLADRFQLTKDPTEYYNIMPYLYKHVEEDKLFRPYHKRFKGTVLKEGSVKTNTRRPSKFAH